MENFTQTGFYSDGYSAPVWRGSRSNKFDFAQRHHFRVQDSFNQSNMIPKLSQHFVHQQKRHFTISKSKQKAFKFTDFYELYKPALTQTLKYPKINDRTLLLSNMKLKALRNSKSKERSSSVHPQNRSLFDLQTNSVQIGAVQRRNKSKNKHMLSQSHRPYNYDIVNFRDLLDDNKRTLRSDQKKSMIDIEYFSKRR